MPLKKNHFTVTYLYFFNKIRLKRLTSSSYIHAHEYNEYATEV